MYTSNMGMVILVHTVARPSQSPPTVRPPLLSLRMRCVSIRLDYCSMLPLILTQLSSLYYQNSALAVHTLGWTFREVFSTSSQMNQLELSMAAGISLMETERRDSLLTSLVALF